MKGVMFYLDFNTPKRKRKGEHTGNVIAAHVKQDGAFLGFHSGESYLIECISAVFEEGNSSVCSSSASIWYLSDSCKRISEAKAREIHPALFDRLDLAVKEGDVSKQG